MKILITGGGGFLGSALLEKLSLNHQITCLDRGRRYNVLKKEINQNIKLVKGDILNKEILNKVTKDCECIIHLAGGGGERNLLKNPYEALLNNVYAIKLLIKYAKKNNVKKIIFSSSYMTYITNPKKIKGVSSTFYGLIKRICEDEIRKSGIPYIILRLSTIYGPYGYKLGIQKEAVIGKFISLGFDNSEITLFNKGKDKQDYLYIDDFSNAINKIVLSDIENKTFDVGSGKSYSVKNVAGIISKVMLKKYKKKIRKKKKYPN